MLRRDFIAAVAAVASGMGIRGSANGGLAAIPPEDGVEPLRRVGHADVRRFEDVTALIRSWYYRAGGGVTLPAASAQLQWLVQTNRRAVIASTAVRRRLQIAIADLGSVVAWAHFDAERHEPARRLWLGALDAARRAGEPSLAGSILRQLADQALHRGPPHEAFRLVNLAYPTAADPANRVPGLLTAHLATYEAWCRAALGDGPGCERAHGLAEEHFENSVGADGTHRDTAPPWFCMLDRAEFAALRGHAYYVLATTGIERAGIGRAGIDRAGIDRAGIGRLGIGSTGTARAGIGRAGIGQVEAAAARAEPLLSAAVAGFEPGFVCGRVINTIALSGSYFARRDGIEQGVALGHQAVSGVERLSSSRCRSRLRDLIVVTEPYAAVPDVADLRERARRAIVDGTADPGTAGRARAGEDVR